MQSPCFGLSTPKVDCYELGRQPNNILNFWDYPDDSEKSLSRPVIIRIKDKDIPDCDIHTNLKTMGVSLKNFIEDLSSFD